MAKANEPGELTPVEWEGLERVVERFESAWQQGKWPAIEEYLPDGGPVRRATLVELVHTDLECRLKAGVPVRVEGYLAWYPELAADRALVLDLIVAEQGLRSRWETGLTVDEYLQRFPQYAEELAARLKPAAVTIEEYAHSVDTGAAGMAAPAPPPPSAIPSLAALVAVLDEHQLLQPVERQELGNILKKFYEPRGLARNLVERGWLTPMQVNRLFQGRAQELILGPYLLLERLGTGGMGDVYKARHREQAPLVAVKILHAHLVKDPLIVRRFHREIRALIKLSHPHVVGALEAGKEGNTHYIVLEYVEGIDLSSLVKQQGPQPISRACSYVRQAALGLQHAHEHGLVHRDVKPSNLILRIEDSVVKVLDLGLARLIPPREAGEPSTTLTQEGAVVGTPDYMAPEQTLDAHAVDIRADIYSLGCTFYYLLTGKLPFPGKNLAEKLLRHQVQEAEPVEHLRAEVPETVTAILRKMMAKRPEDRYQTPGEVAAALVSGPGKRRGT